MPYFKRSISIYDFLPLHGDPTAEELRKEKEKEYKRNEVEAMEIFAVYEKLGLIKPINNN